MLRRNYRSHPSMLFLPSKFFYHNQLIATADTADTQVVLGWRELANPDFPIMFGAHAATPSACTLQVTLTMSRLAQRCECAPQWASTGPTAGRTSRRRSTT